MAAPTPPGWYVISLRPVGGHAGVRRAAARHGAGVVALSPWRLAPRSAAEAGEALARALAADRVVYTSPAAVRAAADIAALDRPGQLACAVGAGTAAALRRAGAGRVLSPARMDSTGLLALEPLQAVDGDPIGLVTAPGGRDRIVETLRRRGARVLRADVYDRVPGPPASAAVARLLALERPAVLLVSSGEALARILEALPAQARTRLLQGPAVVASERLRAVAVDHGIRPDAIALAQGPRPARLVAAAAALHAVRAGPRIR